MNAPSALALARQVNNAQRPRRTNARSHSETGRNIYPSKLSRPKSKSYNEPKTHLHALFCQTSSPLPFPLFKLAYTGHRLLLEIRSILTELFKKLSCHRCFQTRCRFVVDLLFNCMMRLFCPNSLTICLTLSLVSTGLIPVCDNVTVTMYIQQACILVHFG